MNPKKWFLLVISPLLVAIAVYLLIIKMYTVDDNSFFKTNNNMIKAQYGTATLLAKNEKTQFDDFVISFIGSETVKLGVFGGAERSRTDYKFKIFYQQNGANQETEVVWSYGYPGGLSGTAFSVNTQKFMINPANANNLGTGWIITKLSN